MAQAKCGSCGSTQFDVEEVVVFKMVGPMRKHGFAFTVLKCATCGVVHGAAEGSLASIARIQTQR